MTAKSDSDSPLADHEIVSRRVFSASREKLFAACSDPAQVVKWWGPHGFTSTISTFDFRPGGRWRMVMRGPDGAEYPGEKEFTEIVRPERIVSVHIDPVHRFQMTMRFVERNGGTELIWRMRFDFAEEFARVKDFIIPANEQNFDRLAAHLST